MEKETISKILDYYFEKDKFKNEILRAVREFFNKPKLKIGDKLEIEDEKIEAMFCEWFVFDFKFSNGKTPLEDFYERNPYNLNTARLQVYKTLQDNQFGFYKVKKIRLGEGLTLENLQTGKIYEVREFKATFGLKEEQIFTARVGKVGDHYELVGSGVFLGPFSLDSRTERVFRKEKKKLSPKTLQDIFSRKDEIGESVIDFPSLEEAEANFAKVLAKYNLDQFVTTETIKEWIYNCSDENSFNFINLLCSLLDFNIENYNQAITDISDSFNSFYNHCPQKSLGDKSPNEKMKEWAEDDLPHDILISFTKFSPSIWIEKYNKALEYLKRKDFKKALKKFKEIFAYLMKHKITHPEIYRVFANKGICHFALNEPQRGEFMLKISIELNPFYKFAQQRLKEIEKHKKQNPHFWKIKKQEDVTQDISYKYYQFLKSLKINFSSLPKTKNLLKVKKFFIRETKN